MKDALRRAPSLVLAAAGLLALLCVPAATAIDVPTAQLPMGEIHAAPSGLAGASASAQGAANTSTGGSEAAPLIVLGPQAPAGRAQTLKSARVPDATPTGAAKAAGAALGIGLLAYFAFPFFSRIDGNRILDNGVRNRVFAAIEHNPGITIKEVVQSLGIGWGTAIYHLKRLETEHVVVSERNRQFRRYYKNGGGIANQNKGAFAELKNPTTQRLAAEILRSPGAAQKDLCTAAGISAPLAHKYLNRMADADLLTKQRDWKTVKYFPTSRLSELLDGAPLVIA
jgi:DNA-binding MarR family transcriptional regulator